MSRIIVKNLPKYLNEDRFKDHFSACGKQITDIRLVRSKNGKFRGFGFIGYKTKEDALNSIKYYHNTFIDTSRISVEYAKEVDFVTLGLRNTFKNDKFSFKDCIHSENNKLAFDELMEQKRENKKPCISLEHVQIGSSGDFFGKNDDVFSKNKLDCLDDSIDVNNNSLYSHSVSDEKANNMHSYNNFLHCKEQTYGCSNLHNFKKSFDVSYVKTMTNDDWVKSKLKQIKELGDENCNDCNSDDELDNQNSFLHEKNVSGLNNDNVLSLKEQILLSGRLFVRNLPYSISESELRIVFENFGKLIDVHVPYDSVLNMTKGFAYILFENPSCALNAYELMDGRALYGRLIHILPARVKRASDRSESYNGTNFKNERAKRRKIDALDKRFSWNSLYMNPDAVISSVADKLGVSKTDILDPTSSNSSVRQALAETYVIQETKKYFEKSGVNLESFSGFELDDYVLLAKNFPYGTTLDELSKLFGKYGTLGRVLLPPSGTIAIVEFLESKSADNAFKCLSYRRFKDSILYLEKAPLNIFKEKFDSTIDLQTANSQKSKAIYDIDINIENDNVNDSERAILFIKNLNFSTTLDSLNNAFSPFDGFVNVVIKTKSDPKRPGNRLSMGFGFVEFKSRYHALLAMHVMKGYVLDGHVLQIKESQKNNNFSLKDKISQNKCKIVIKNLPFETTKKDIRELFGSYGYLKSVRVPKKIDNSIRGFAFVEYVTSRDAKNAFNILKNTHLLGRHLILEWADDSVVNDSDNRQKLVEKN
ncbi:hypothetical protein PNEG_03605 [Pneumocystis murina B123]|uniref:RRM domain-containing protein n=1 Tax=Pneumocystis murina (strain B123) TaxID=1069680 RepID=M7PKD6_PNEMU|nr:hypothetical protein PNEG_03605 [Pneumocystis murina B123]EMR10914.1 hypothetical protein PNEG_03605 [Pneumocystis murina B123]